MDCKIGDKIATREAYGKALAELGADHDFVVLDADLAEATKTCYFAKAYPDRFFDCGIAEGNMVGIAAGLAAAGKTVVASSFAMFAAGRAFEQIRNSVAYPHLNVKICATHAGITVGEDGATHQCLEDLALMRSIPGMTVINPADAVEAAAALKYAIETDGPFYIRFGRYAVPVVHDPATYRFEPGKGDVLMDGSDVTIVTTGMMAETAIQAAAVMDLRGVSTRIINIHTAPSSKRPPPRRVLSWCWRSTISSAVWAPPWPSACPRPVPVLFSAWAYRIPSAARARCPLCWSCTDSTPRPPSPRSRRLSG